MSKEIYEKGELYKKIERDERYETLGLVKCTPSTVSDKTIINILNFQTILLLELTKRIEQIETKIVENKLLEEKTIENKRSLDLISQDYKTDHSIKELTTQLKSLNLEKGIDNFSPKPATWKYW